MSDEQHVIFRENIPAYALDALDVDEAAALKAHLRTCETCRAELEDYQRVSAGLLSALPPQAPRPSLRRTLAARLPGARKSARPRWQLQWSFGQFATAMIVVLLLGMNLLSFMQLQALRNQQARLSRQFETQQAALAVLASPGAAIFPIASTEVTGSLVVNSEQNSGVLILSNLPELEQGKTYQIWFIKPDQGRVSAGLFGGNRPEDITIVSIKSPAPLFAYTGIGVTIEPAGGSEGPTGPKILGVDF